MSAQRPASVVELAEQTKEISNSWDEAKSLKRHLVTANGPGYRRVGLEKWEDGDQEAAFVLLSKAAILIFEKIPKHRDFNRLLNKSQIHNLGLVRNLIRRMNDTNFVISFAAGYTFCNKQNGQKLLDDIAVLKSRITYDYNNWLNQSDGSDDHSMAEGRAGGTHGPKIPLRHSEHRPPDIPNDVSQPTAALVGPPETSPSHFHVSDGSDMMKPFSEIAIEDHTYPDRGAISMSNPVQHFETLLDSALSTLLLIKRADGEPGALTPHTLAVLNTITKLAGANPSTSSSPNPGNCCTPDCPHNSLGDSSRPH